MFHLFHLLAATIGGFACCAVAYLMLPGRWREAGTPADVEWREAFRRRGLAPSLTILAIIWSASIAVFLKDGWMILHLFAALAAMLLAKRASRLLAPSFAKHGNLIAGITMLGLAPYWFAFLSQGVPQ